MKCPTVGRVSLWRCHRCHRLSQRLSHRLSRAQVHIRSMIHITWCVHAYVRVCVHLHLNARARACACACACVKRGNPPTARSACSQRNHSSWSPFAVSSACISSTLYDCSCLTILLVFHLLCLPVLVLLLYLSLLVLLLHLSFKGVLLLQITPRHV